MKKSLERDASQPESYLWKKPSASIMRGRADIHVHTKYSGVHRFGIMRFPESVSEPRDIFKTAERTGMNVIAITDHNTTAGAMKALELSKEFPAVDIIVGEEISTLDGEVIGLFLKEEIPAGLSINETIRMIREQGGLTVAPHPFSPHCPCLKDQIYSTDLDGDRGNKRWASRRICEPEGRRSRKTR